MPSQSPNEFVITSAVRTAIVRRLAETTASTDVLLSETDASDSAVYDALSTLRDRGLITESDRGWELTAHGALVADSVSAWQSAEAFLARDPAFWKTHRIDVIPPAFRRRLLEIGDYEIIRDGPQDPNKSEDIAISMLESADYCELTTPYYSRRHEAAIPTHPETRLLVTREAIDVSLQRYADGHREELAAVEPSRIRLTDCQFASVVTDDRLKFELPTLSEASTTRHTEDTATDPASGGAVTDTSAIFVSETDAAVEFGRDLFAELWAESDPLEPYMERQFPELFS
ncbi:MAG: helix-turn-helix transcriptional regulator [Halohasta sp.]